MRFLVKDNRILITNDKDFGEKIFRERYPHKGVILLRLGNERYKNKMLFYKNFYADIQANLQSSLLW